MSPTTLEVQPDEVARLEREVAEARARREGIGAEIDGQEERYRTQATEVAQGKRDGRAALAVQDKIRELTVTRDGLDSIIDRLGKELTAARQRAREAAAAREAQERKDRFTFLSREAEARVPQIFEAYRRLADLLAEFDELRIELAERFEAEGGPAVNQRLHDRVTANPTGPGEPFRLLIDAGWRERLLAPGGPVRLVACGMVRPAPKEVKR